MKNYEEINAAFYAFLSETASCVAKKDFRTAEECLKHSYNILKNMPKLLLKEQEQEKQLKRKLQILEESNKKLLLEIKSKS